MMVNKQTDGLFSSELMERTHSPCSCRDTGWGCPSHHRDVLMFSVLWDFLSVASPVPSPSTQLKRPSPTWPWETLPSQLVCLPELRLLRKPSCRLCLHVPHAAIPSRLLRHQGSPEQLRTTKCETSKNDKWSCPTSVALSRGLFNSGRQHRRGRERIWDLGHMIHTPTLARGVHVPPLQKTRHKRMLLADALSQGSHSDCSRTQISLGCSQVGHHDFRETDVRDGLEYSSQLACKPMILSSFCFLRCMFRFHTLLSFSLFRRSLLFLSSSPLFLPSFPPPFLLFLLPYLPSFLSSLAFQPC